MTDSPETVATPPSAPTPGGATTGDMPGTVLVHSPVVPESATRVATPPTSPTVLELLVLGALTAASVALIAFPIAGVGAGLLALIAGVVLSRRGSGSRAIVAAVLAGISGLALITCAAILIFFTTARIEQTPGEVTQVET